MKTRANFYLDADPLNALKKLARSEETSISDSVREGIDRVITQRMQEPIHERDELRANLQTFLKRYGVGAERTLEEIERLVSDVERSRDA